MDAATPALLVHCVRGTIIPEALLTVRKGAEFDDYLFITMTNVSIVLVAPNAGFGGEITEQVALSYASATMQYKPQDNTGQLGAALSATVEGCS